MKKILALILCTVCAFSLFAACGNKQEEETIELPVAEHNEAITKPDGQFQEIDGQLTAEGGLVKLSDSHATLIIDNVEYEFVLSDEVKRKIEIFNKDENNLQIMRGTILRFIYTEENEAFTATDIEIINAN